MDKPENPGLDENPVTWFSGEDPEMQEAILKAQQTYGEFKREIALEHQRILPAHEASLVKYAFDANVTDVEVEHMFLSDIELKSDGLSGSLVSDPQYTNVVSYGDRVDIDPLRVSDWLYVIEGVGTGGFTFKVMWRNFSDDEKSQYGTEPPYLWIEKK